MAHAYSAALQTSSTSLPLYVITAVLDKDSCLRL